MCGPSFCLYVFTGPTPASGEQTRAATDHWASCVVDQPSAVGLGLAARTRLRRRFVVVAVAACFRRPVGDTAGRCRVSHPNSHGGAVAPAGSLVPVPAPSRWCWLAGVGVRDSVNEGDFPVAGVDCSVVAAAGQRQIL